MNLFVLGILSTIATIMVAVIVVGIVKILKLTKQLKDLETTFFQSRGDLYRNIEERIHTIWKQFDDTGRDITMVEQTLRNQIEEAKRQTEDAVTVMCHADRRYTDSRIDKLIDTYFEHVGAKTPSKKNKELING